ncbi:hypothetical protein PV318_00080 [Streptomyces sp. ME02-6991-2B]|nr:hypothetical protein [Streptomyces sp. ME02-6991-2B]
MSLTATHGSTVIGSIQEAHFHTQQNRRSKGNNQSQVKNVYARKLRNEIAAAVHKKEVGQVLKSCKELIEIGSGSAYRREIAWALTKLFAEYGNGASKQRFEAAEVLEGFGPDYFDDAAQLLWGIAGLAGLNSWERQRALGALLVLGRRYFTSVEPLIETNIEKEAKGKSYHELFAALRERREPNEDLWELFNLTNELAPIWRAIREFDDIGRLDNAPTPGLSIKEFREHRKQAKLAKGRFDSRLDRGELDPESAIWLMERGAPHREYVVNRVNKYALECTQNSLHSNAGIAYSMLGPEFRDRAVHHLALALRDPKSSATDCQWSAHLLVEHDESYSQEGASIIARHLYNDTIPHDDRVGLAYSLAALDPVRATEAANALTHLFLTSKEMDLDDRMEIIHSLEGMGRIHISEVAEAFRSIMGMRGSLSLDEREMPVASVIRLNLVASMP